MRISALALAATLPVVACGPAPSSEPPGDTSGRYPITGTVVGQPGDGTITLAHDAIANYMPAMVMELRVDALPPVADGVRVRATLVVTDGESRLTDVVVAPRASTLAAPEPASLSSSAPLRVASLGAVMPDVAVTNQDGEVLRVGDMRGRVVFINFIYTRCPLPEFCPRLMAQFDTLLQAVVDDDELGGVVQFLSVTMDPEHDTPPVLRAYGERSITGASPFDQWDLVTGEAAALRELAAFSGVAYRSVEGWIEHSMETVIVGADGRLVRRFETGAWDHDEAMAIARREARRVEVF